MKRLITLICSLAIAVVLQAQDVLTLEAAFTQALQNNYQIRMQQNQQAIAQNSATIGNAGLLPSVSADASIGVNVTNTQLEFAGGIPPPMWMAPKARTPRQAFRPTMCSLTDCAVRGNTRSSSST